MFARTTRHERLFIVAALVFATGCEHPRTSEEVRGISGALSAAPLSGRVAIDGSSTVLPISRALSDVFQTANPGVRVSVESSGTGGAFKKPCAGAVDIVGASRPINAAESQQCQASGVEFIELPIGFDSLSIVVNARNSFVECLTVNELKKMCEPAAEGTVTRWDQIRSHFAAEPLLLFGPGTTSGTFDYFTLAIVGEEGRSRNDYTKSEDDTVLVNGVAGNPNALGYFGYAYYSAHKDKLKLISIDNGHGCVAPTADTVADATYQPLSRPLFIYVSKSSATRPEAIALASSYVAPQNARYMRELGYVPLPAATLLSVARRLDKSVTGSMFGGRGSVVGVTADVFQDDDRIKSALVR
jgi:phosphate transport system substrate-binding protein